MDYEKASRFWLEQDAHAVKMKEEDLKKEIEDFILSHHVCALATASGSFVRNTPIEYNYYDGYFYLFSEGGLKFKALKDNKNVCLAIFDPEMSFSGLRSLQVTGVAAIIEPYGEEYRRVAERKKLPLETLKKLPDPLNLIRVTPTIYDLLESSLKKRGYSSRQELVLKRE